MREVEQLSSASRWLRLVAVKDCDPYGYSQRYRLRSKFAGASLGRCTNGLRDVVGARFIGKNQAELVAPEPRREVKRRGVRHENLGNVAQDDLRRRGVVLSKSPLQELKMVDVDQQKRQRVLVIDRSFDLILERILKPRGVYEIRERCAPQLSGECDKIFDVRTRVVQDEHRVADLHPGAPLQRGFALDGDAIHRRAVTRVEVSDHRDSISEHDLQVLRGNEVIVQRDLYAGIRRGSSADHKGKLIQVSERAPIPAPDDEQHGRARTDELLRGEIHRGARNGPASKTPGFHGSRKLSPAFVT